MSAKRQRSDIVVLKIVITLDICFQWWSFWYCCRIATYIEGNGRSNKLRRQFYAFNKFFETIQGINESKITVCNYSQISFINSHRAHKLGVQPSAAPVVSLLGTPDDPEICVSLIEGCRGVGLGSVVLEDSPAWLLFDSRGAR